MTYGRTISLITAMTVTLGAVAVADNATPAAATEMRERATSLRVASFNVLGNSHTKNGGTQEDLKSGKKRMRWAAQILRRLDLDVIGLQELQAEQWHTFKEELGSRYRMFPSAELGQRAMQNSIAWDYTQWYAVRKETIPIPYFDHDIEMPYVQLRNRQTNRRVWVFNSHNPANTRGNARKARLEGFAREAALVNRLKHKHPERVVISTGDKNARRGYVCRMMKKSPLRPANGGAYTKKGCVPPDEMHIDWIMSTSPAHATDFRAVRTKLVRRVTDHPVIVATFRVPGR